MAKTADPLDGYVTKRSAGRTGAIKRKGKFRNRFTRRRIAQDLRWIAQFPELVL